MAEGKVSRLDLWTRIKSLLPGEEHGKEEAKVEEAPPPEDAFKKETQERQAAADAAITDFVKGQLGDPNAPPPPWRLPKPRDTQTQEDRAKMREAMGEGWTEIERRAKQVAAGHKDAAHDHVWAVYTRQSTPHSLDELILVYMLAGHAYATVQNKIEERGYFEYFFAKISHLLLQQRDKYDNTLLHYLLAFEGSKSARVVACMDAMARAAKRQAKQSGADEKTKGMTIEERSKSDTLDDRKTVHQFFAEQKNVVGESVMDLMVRFGDRKTLKQAETILAHLFSPEEEAAASAAKGTGLDRVQAVQEKPFNQADFEAIIGGDDTAAKALYIRMFADHIAPEQMEAALKSKQVDLMQLDLAEITLAKDQARNITKKNAIAPGAVNNSYAKQGIFNVEFARKKLVRDDGKRSQGFRDERGYNTYMQMAALKSMPSAYIDNEHEFWDSIFTRIAKFQAQNDQEKREVRYFYTRTARDVLDTPGNDGKTALHLAAMNGNERIARFILDKVLDFSAAEKLKEAQEQRLAKEVLGRRKAYLEEMRTNLGYLTGADSESHNPWTLALFHGHKNVLMAMVGRLEKYPEYLEILAMLPVWAKIPGYMSARDKDKGMTLVEYATRMQADSQDQQEAVRYIRTILRAAEDRTKMRQEQGRNIGKQGLV